VKKIVIREIFQIPRYGKFPRFPGIWEISKIFKIHHHQIPIEIWGISKISQIPRHLGNFPDTQVFGIFLRFWKFLK